MLDLVHLRGKHSFLDDWYLYIFIYMPIHSYIVQDIKLMNVEKLVCFAQSLTKQEPVT